MEPTKFCYNPLQEQDAIRLLLLEPSERPEDDLQGRLIFTTIQECVDDIYTGYIAISYVWGDLSSEGTITLDGQHFPLTPSLDAALRGVRDTSVACRVWADAICIDQSNITERNQQVSLMRQIYSTADHTVIFLGSLTSDAESVLRAARSQGQSKDMSGLSLSPGAETDILGRPWFTRTWIMQELVLSRDPVVQCGRLRTRWSNLCSLLPGSVGPARALRAMDTARVEFQRSGTTLFGLLSSRRGAGATDPRDMVYGLLGMLSGPEKLPSGFVDYSLSVDRVYAMTARYILEAGPWLGSLASGQEWPGLQMLLSAADDGTRRRNPKALPSWVPDWTLAKEIEPLPNNYSQGLFNAAQRNEPLEDPRQWCVVVDEPPTLVCVGSRLPLAVDELSPVFPPPSAVPFELLEQCQKTFSNIPWPEGLFRSSRDVSNLPRPGGLFGSSRDVSNLVPAVRRFAGAWTSLCNAVQVSQDDQDKSDTFAVFQMRFQVLLVDWIYDGIGAQSFYNPPFLKVIRSYLDGGHVASPLEGRRLAVMGESVGVVPRHSRPGDVCVSLFPSLCLYTVREEPKVDGAWEQAVLDSAQSLRLWREERSGPRFANTWRPVTKPGSVGTWGRLLGECYTNWLPENAISDSTALSPLSDHIVALV